ncbi:hypothetical protein J6590_051300 [Homalodisca vitripennis]|nr:hypothetical protein J6590_051300 [Homalodisca vitripennis]
MRGPHPVNMGTLTLTATQRSSPTDRTLVADAVVLSSVAPPSHVVGDPLLTESLEPTLSGWRSDRGCLDGSVCRVVRLSWDRTARLLLDPTHLALVSKLDERNAKLKVEVTRLEEDLTRVLDHSIEWLMQFMDQIFTPKLRAQVPTCAHTTDYAVQCHFSDAA